MGELYSLILIFLVFCIGGGYLVLRYLLPRKPQLSLNEGGTWRRTQETVAERNGSRVRVLLVREHEGRETGRLVIAEISVGDKNWNELYLGAVAKADNDLALLESAERH